MEVLKWLLISCQLIAWGWFSGKGGQLSDRKFLIFTAGMMLGQIGASFETYFSSAWATFVVQIYFLVFTAYGGVKRIRIMRAAQGES